MFLDFEKHIFDSFFFWLKLVEKSKNTRVHWIYAALIKYLRLDGHLQQRNTITRNRSIHCICKNWSKWMMQPYKWDSNMCKREFKSQQSKFWYDFSWPRWTSGGRSTTVIDRSTSRSSSTPFRTSRSSWTSSGSSPLLLLPLPLANRCSCLPTLQLLK